MDPQERLAEHRAGKGARLCQVWTEAGISFEIVATWAADRQFERRLKNRHNHWRECPRCRAARREGAR